MSFNMIGQHIKTNEVIEEVEEDLDGWEDKEEKDPEENQEEYL